MWRSWVQQLYIITAHVIIWTHIQDIHKIMAQFQKLTRNLFLTLHWHNIQRQQRQLSKFLMGYQQFPSHAYCGASFQDGVAAGKRFLCTPLWGVQHGLEKTHHAWCAWETWTVAAADGVHCARVGWDKFLVNFWNRTILLCIPCTVLLNFMRGMRSRKHRINSRVIYPAGVTVKEEEFVLGAHKSATTVAYFFAFENTFLYPIKINKLISGLR